MRYGLCGNFWGEGWAVGLISTVFSPTGSVVCRWGGDSSQPPLSSAMYETHKIVSSSTTTTAPYPTPGDSDNTTLHASISRNQQTQHQLPVEFTDNPQNHTDNSQQQPVSTVQHWSPQFRRMSPSMLLAIDAVRSGKMGFTQAGKTFGVNGRTLWVYYRKLGYEVHNTFRGKKSKLHPPSLGNVDVQSSANLRETITANMNNIRETMGVVHQPQQENVNRNIEHQQVHNSFHLNNQLQHQNNINSNDSVSLNSIVNNRHDHLNALGMNLSHNMINNSTHRDNFIDQLNLVNSQLNSATNGQSNESVICKEEVVLSHEVYNVQEPICQLEHDNSSEETGRRKEDESRTLESLLETYNVRNFWPNHL